MSVGKTCWCGLRAVKGSSRCAQHQLAPKAAPPERSRRESQPWRSLYSTSQHRRRRRERYDLAGGRCEGCGVPLRGHLFPNAFKWELHDVVDLADGGDTSLENGRCLCVQGPNRCHYKATAAARRRDRGR